ncbi:MAG TPA: universal stress protein [Pseudonocardiaceae bacterium]|nr:universal stress protein [Pseudonocardiaceae bacterium]
MGQPAQVLLDEAHGADLLIVGSRGHGGFAGLLLGSVSHQCACAHPAQCSSCMNQTKPRSPSRRQRECTYSRVARIASGCRGRSVRARLDAADLGPLAGPWRDPNGGPARPQTGR